MTTTETSITLGKLIEQSNIPAALIRAVVLQMGSWESFTASAPDITRHGIDGGFTGFVYGRDTEAFARRNRADIAKLAKDQADDMGESVFDMIAGFGCLGGRELRNLAMPSYGDRSKEESRRKILASYYDAIGSALYAGKDLPDGEPVLNALAWYAGEEVSREYCRLTEQD